MTSHRKTYSFVPGWDMPAAALSLGDILTDPTSPHRPLHTTPLTPLLANMPVRRTELALHTYTHSNATNTKPSLWTQFLQISSLGAEGAVTFGLDDEDVYKCEKMETEWCAPPAAFVQQALARDDDDDDDDVQGYLAFGEFGASRRVS